MGSYSMRSRVARTRAEGCAALSLLLLATKGGAANLNLAGVKSVSGYQYPTMASVYH